MPNRNTLRGPRGTARGLRWAALLCAAVALAACERQATTTAAGTWRLQEIKTLVGPGPGQAFFGVRGVAIRPDGRLAVVEEDAKRVSVFEPNGAFVAVVGRIGKGVGEYTLPYSAAWLGDSLGVYDAGTGRVVTYTGTTAPAGERPTFSITGDAIVRWYPVSPAKAYLRTVRGSGTTFSPALIGYDSRGPGDTVALPPPPKTPMGTTCHMGAGSEYMQWPEQPLQMVLPVRSDGALAIAYADDYRINVVGPRGDTLTRITRDIPRAPMRLAQWDSALDRFHTLVQRYGPTVCDAPPGPPSYFAPLRAMTLSADGNLWVTVLTKNGITFDVYGLDGTFKASIPAPSHVMSVPVAASADHLVLVTDVKAGAVPRRQVVHVYSITR